MVELRYTENGILEEVDPVMTLVPLCPFASMVLRDE
jgi:hypothetical protein